VILNFSLCRFPWKGNAKVVYIIQHLIYYIAYKNTMDLSEHRMKAWFQRHLNKHFNINQRKEGKKNGDAMDK
jgi:hypothetical protein